MRVGSIENESEPRARSQSFEMEDGGLGAEIPSNGPILDIPYLHDVVLREEAVGSRVRVPLSPLLTVHDPEEGLVGDGREFAVTAALHLNRRPRLVHHAAVL